MPRRLTPEEKERRRLERRKKPSAGMQKNIDRMKAIQDRARAIRAADPTITQKEAVSTAWEEWRANQQ